MNFKRLAFGIAASGVFLASAVPVFAVAPGAAVNNPNADANACWGMDRSFYASEGYFPENMDIKQSFPGDVGDQRAAWVATYCVSHGPQQ